MPKIDIKGNKITYGGNLDVSQGAIERQMFEMEQGPRMLDRRTRFRVWTALLCIGGWFVACFYLIAYRLRSDDLELMEREVYEELKMKKQVQEFISKSKNQDRKSASM